MVHDLQNAERMDVMSVSDEPHDWYAPHPFDEDAAISEPYEGDRGNVLLKNVEYSTIECPECEEDIPTRRSERGEPVCPECGMICSAPERPDYPIICDPKTAERVDDNGNFIQ